jgi:AraC-like DNA-binding protein
LREFVEEQRLQKAINLLISTDMTLSEIAYECGFSSQSYFSSVFKQKMKITPREYAKKIQQKYEE